MSTLVDRTAATAFLAFVAIEWKVGDELLAWKLRLLWVVVALSAILLSHRLDREQTAEPKLTTSYPKPHQHHVERQIIASASAPVVANLDTSVTKGEPAILAETASSPDSSPSEILLPLPTDEPSSASAKSKRRSFVKRTAASLFSPLRRSSRSVSKKEDKEGSSQERKSDSFKSQGVEESKAVSITPDAFDVHPEPHPALPAPQKAVPSQALTVADAFGFGPDAIKPPSSFVYVRKNNWGYLGHLDAAQMDALNQFRAFNFSCMESRTDTPSFKIDDETLLRFLRARKFDVEKARRMFEAHLAWRDKFTPSTLTPNDISSVLGSGLARFGPYSKNGLPSTIIKVEFYDPAKFDGDVDLFTRYVAFFFERAVGRLPAGADKGILFYDMKGWSLRKHATRFSLKLIAELINIIQAHNPERLEKCILFNTPLVFSGTWSLIKGLLDPVVADKVVFVSDTSVVLEMFDKDDLPVEYGGSRVLPYPIEGFAELHTANELQ